MARLKDKKKIVNNCPFYWFDQKEVFPSSLNFSLDFSFLKHVEKKLFLSNVKLLSKSSQIFDPKEKFSVNFGENTSNHLKSLV